MSDLFSLAQQNKVDELRAMLNKGIGAKAADEHGRTLLHHAAAVNAVSVIDLLLERGALLDAKDIQGLTVRSRHDGGRNPQVDHSSTVCSTFSVNLTVHPVPSSFEYRIMTLCNHICRLYM
jgi:ankyrin repeat protein